jgi:hypothetical protein
MLGKSCAPNQPHPRSADISNQALNLTACVQEVGSCGSVRAALFAARLACVDSVCGHGGLGGSRVGGESHRPYEIQSGKMVEGESRMDHAF